MTKPATPEEFAARLKAMAGMRDMTDREVAAVFGVNRTTISMTRFHHPEVEWTGKRKVCVPQHRVERNAKPPAVTVAEPPAPNVRPHFTYRAGANGGLIPVKVSLAREPWA